MLLVSLADGEINILLPKVNFLARLPKVRVLIITNTQWRRQT